MSTVLPWQPTPIPPLARDLAPALRTRIDRKTKPPGSLGRLEELALQIGQIQGTTSPTLDRANVLIFAGDHGLASEGVSPFPAAVTVQMVHNFLQGGAGINVLARRAGLPVLVIDAGVASDLPPHPNLRQLKVRHGTRNALHEPALTGVEVDLCLKRGAELVAGLAEAGCQAILPGEMGIGNSSAAALLYSALLDLPIEQCVGVGAGHDTAGLARKREILSRVRMRHGSVHGRDALAAFGGCEIAMMTGAMLEAAARRLVIVVDGFIATAAALVASRIDRTFLDYCVFAHESGDTPHTIALNGLGARPLLRLGMRLGEATGAAMAWPILQASVAFLAEMATFDSAGVSEKTAAAPQG
jgi:nicotinate-nucleotide--dimethylbenzimidazole phosphoribosyltransferase